MKAVDAVHRGRAGPDRRRCPPATISRRGRPMNRTVHKLCAWSGIGCLVLMAIGFVGLARFFPPPAPSLSAEETTRIIIDHAATIRWGMILTMAAAVLLGVMAV